MKIRHCPNPACEDQTKTTVVFREGLVAVKCEACGLHGPDARRAVIQASNGHEPPGLRMVAVDLWNKLPRWTEATEVEKMP